VNAVAQLWSVLQSLTPQQWAAIGQACERILFELGLISSALSFLLGVLGTWYPWALRAAMRFSDVALRLHGWGLKFGSMLPGGKSPEAAKMASMRPRPSLTEICSQCGTPLSAPSTLPTGR
jgi:hypothetical protein